MLKCIEIKGFRSFSQESFQKVELQPLTVIVGENDAGKSNILKALQIVLNPSIDNISREDFNIRKSKLRNGKIGDKKASQIVIKLHLTNKTKLLPYKYQRSSYHKNQDMFTIKCTVSGRGEKHHKEYCLNDKKIEPSSVKLLLSKMHFFITPSVRDVNHLNELKKMLPIEKSSSINKDVNKFLATVKGKLKKQESLIKKATDSEKVVISPLLSSEDVLKVLDFDFSIVKDAIPIQLKNHGQGMISKIILSWFLEQGKKCFIGIEEPEIHIHPNLMRESISDCDQMVKKGTQIIIVTHSPYFLNHIPITRISVARKDNKYTRLYSLATFSPEIAQKIERDVFLHRQKGEILFAKGVILLEGPYDRRIFTVIDAYSKIKTYEHGINLIDVGGDGIFETYINLCIKAGIPWVVIGDKKAFYVNGKNGPLLEAIRPFINELDGNELINKIKSNITCRSELNKINNSLKSKKGMVLNLTGDDISDTLINILSKLSDDTLYKKLYVSFGGHQNESDLHKVKNDVVKTIKKAKEEMVQAIPYFASKTNELDKVFKKALSHLI